MNAPGKTLIKVVSIIYFFGAAINIITGAIALVVSPAIGISAIAFGLYQIFLAAMGLKYCNEPEKAQTLLIIGVVAIVWIIIQMIVTFTPIGLVGLLLPILYLVGAFKNKNFKA